MLILIAPLSTLVNWMNRVNWIVNWIVNQVTFFSWRVTACVVLNMEMEMEMTTRFF